MALRGVVEVRQGRLVTIMLDTDHAPKFKYWELHHEGRDVCLSCPLEWCVFDDDSPFNTQCPAGLLTDSQVKISIPERNQVARDRNRQKVFAAIKDNGIEEMLPCSILEISEKSGYSPSAIRKWIEKGYLNVIREWYQKLTVVGINYDK